MTRSSRSRVSSTTTYRTPRASWTPCAKPLRNDSTLAYGCAGRPPTNGAQMTIFNLPDLGEGLAEAEIVRWHVNVGDTVAVDQPMLAVETAKAVSKCLRPSPEW